MGAVDMIAVDPAYQRRGIATQLMSHSAGHMREQGMDIAAVGPGAAQAARSTPRSIVSARWPP
jgi:ribosomal protein S18 acetylase RimI-like enzyme